MSAVAVVSTGGALLIRALPANPDFKEAVEDTQESTVGFELEKSN
jgi:hypothetical protein